jgi:ribosomal protein L19E
MNTAPMNQRNIYLETLREQLQTVKIIKGTTKIEKTTYK